MSLPPGEVLLIVRTRPVWARPNAAVDRAQRTAGGTSTRNNIWGHSGSAFHRLGYSVVGRTPGQRVDDGHPAAQMRRRGA